MGFTTEFIGKFSVSPVLSAEDAKFLRKFNLTRHENESRLIEGIVENAVFPDKLLSCHVGKPGIWCQWVPNEDGSAIIWDKCEKFYNYAEWIIYLIGEFFVKKGYVLNGSMKWICEEYNVQGVIAIFDNIVHESREEDIPAEEEDQPFDNSDEDE